MSFFDSNFNLTKVRTKNGEIVELEINNKEVPLTKDLLAFKYSSSYLYAKYIPSEDRSDVTVYTGGAITKATADYNVEKKTDCWTFNSKKYDEDGSEIETPEGSAGTSVALGNYVLASDDKFYVKDTDWFEVLKFGKTAETMSISDSKVTDEALLTELEAATAKALAYVPYTLAAGFTYNNHHYERYSTGDVVIE